jgi:hypothetical protein
MRAGHGGIPATPTSRAPRRRTTRTGRNGPAPQSPLAIACMANHASARTPTNKRMHSRGPADAQARFSPIGGTRGRPSESRQCLCSAAAVAAKDGIRVERRTGAKVIAGLGQPGRSRSWQPTGCGTDVYGWLSSFAIVGQGEARTWKGSSADWTPDAWDAHAGSCPTRNGHGRSAVARGSRCRPRTESRSRSRRSRRSYGRRIRTR